MVSCHSGKRRYYLFHTIIIINIRRIFKIFNVELLDYIHTMPARGRSGPKLKGVMHKEGPKAETK